MVNTSDERKKEVADRCKMERREGGLGVFFSERNVAKPGRFLRECDCVAKRIPKAKNGVLASDLC